MDSIASPAFNFPSRHMFANGRIRRGGSLVTSLPRRRLRLRRPMLAWGKSTMRAFAEATATSGNTRDPNFEAAPAVRQSNVKCLDATPPLLLERLRSILPIIAQRFSAGDNAPFRYPVPQCGTKDLSATNTHLSRRLVES